MRKIVMPAFSVTILAVCLISCKKFVNVGPPLSEAESAKVFSSDPAALSAALGVYANMGLSNLYICSGGSTLYPALSADELIYNSTNIETLSYEHDQVVANNGTGNYSRLWVPAYSNIYNANAVLEGIAASTTLSDSLKKQIEGEMLVVRALNYFYLVNLFGDVPLELTTNYQANSVMPRTPAATIYSQLESDVKTAGALLAPGYPSGMNTRPNKWAADALLARICLYRGEWQNAENYATAVINSTQYQLEKNTADVFSENSTETIWQLGDDYHNTADAATFVPFSASYTPSYSISPDLLVAFGGTDLRLAHWIGKTTVSGQLYYYPDKYKNRNYSPVTEFEVILRLAELYLVRAEARARLGDFSGASADLNMTRQRAGLATVMVSDLPTAMTEIVSERQREFFCEWGHRWLDLKRLALVDSVLSAEKAAYWKPYASLYPLPLSELQNNPKLVQNPGY